MNKLLICAGLIALTTSAAEAQTKATPKKAAPATSKIVMKNLNDSFSYAAGVNIASSMKEQGIKNLNTALVQLAIQDVFNNKTPLLSPEVCNMTLQKQLQEYAMKKSSAEKEKGAAFLAKNKTRAGVTTLPNGLQYEILKAGTGVKPTAADTVVVDYVGTLTDGTEFDNSVKRGEPATFPVGGVIAGWTQILQLMPSGSKWKVYIPSDLAYGDRGAGGAIPPGAALVFEINLLDVKPAVK